MELTTSPPRRRGHFKRLSWSFKSPKLVQPVEAETIERVLKLTVLLYRKPEITEAEFHNYWSKQHARLASPWAARNGILGYTQYHTPSDSPSHAALSSMANASGWRVLDHDGHAEFWIRSLDDLVKATGGDPEYMSVIYPDEDTFIDRARTQVTIGWEDVKVRGGKVVDTNISTSAPVKSKRWSLR